MKDALDCRFLQIDRGEIVAVTGPSGCGKSTLGLAIVGLLPAGAVLTGTLEGEALTPPFRGVRVGWVPQDVTSLSPFHAVGRQLAEVAEVHLELARRDAETKAADNIARLGIDPKRLRDYPHRWSGGMLQRALVVMATMADPLLVIADEPTASLDDTAAAAVNAMLRERACLLMTHDKRLTEGVRLVELSPLRHGAFAG